MQAARQNQEWTGWHTLWFCATMGPTFVNLIEKVASRHYGWAADYVPDTWALAPLLVGSCLTVCWRFANDWRNGKLRLAVHGPLFILTTATVAFTTWHFMAISKGGEVPLEGTMFFLGFSAACFLMLLMSPSEQN